MLRKNTTKNVTSGAEVKYLMPRGSLPLSIRFARPKQVVLPWRAETASRLSVHRDQRVRDRQGAPRRPESAAPEDLESAAGLSAAAAVLHTRDRNLRGGEALALRASIQS